MEEYENPNDMPHQASPHECAVDQNDRYTYYSGMPVRSSEYRYVPEPPKKKKKRKHTWMMVLVVVLCCLLSGAMGVGGVLLAQQIQAEKAEEVPEVDVSYVLQGVRENSVIEIVEIDTGKQMTPAEVYAANVNSTVGITTSVTTNFWGYQSTSAASGSGFIISVDGYILTNFHVIEDSDSISVSMYNGDRYDATLIGCDESNDIAVLKIEAEGLSPVILGNSDNLNVGDSVVAITRQTVSITRLPRAYETITIETWPMPESRVAYPRATVAYDAQGNELFRCIALWILMDLTTRAMVLPGKSGIEYHGITRGGELTSPKSLTPKNLPNATDRKVRFGQLDRNGHMNNTKYLEWAMDLLPGSFHREHPLKGFTVCYLNEAREADRVTLRHSLEENILLVDATRPDPIDETKTHRVFAVKAEFA